LFRGIIGRMLIQIYAFTKIDEAVAAAEMGVDQIGFVAGQYGLVHGELSFAAARRLAEALPSGTTRVALTMATEVDEIVRMAEAVRPDIVHISTDLEDVGVAAMAELRRRLPAGTRLMKALPVGGEEESLEAARRFAPVSDLFLLDSKGRGLPGIGASGLTHDWSISRRIVEAAPIPVILAGGLSAGNVAAAIRAVRPAGVDSNTATNLPGDPLAKDLGRLRAFVAAVRGAPA
jgi:phosphoribosylanthranilate isomerase